jgi:acyl transferase domain-containing protein
MSAHEPLASTARLRKALLAVDRLREKVAALRREESVPVAVIGIGCRFPGASGPAELWQLLRSGADAIREVPASRWSIQDWYDPDLTAPGRMSTRWGGFLDDIESFDPRFFGLSPAEAARMDPQQRLVLEVAWEAIEHAGLAPETLAGTDAGVFIGISALDFPQLIEGVPTRAGTGMIHCIAANRLSYFLDLRGPSMAVDTACSSSLVAVHLAARSLRDGESDLALAGGVNIILSPEWTASFSAAGMMAADGRCKSFDAAADGYVRGEGCGIVVLKRLPDALRDGDRVLAVIRGSAVSQDGRSNGLTAPNGLAQQAVIRKALSMAGVEPLDIDYVESHGSGTPLGDAIEVQSLAAVLGQGRPPARRFLLGSVKTNIGHLESAAGIAGLIKCVLAIQHGEIPPHLHLHRVNPHIDLGRMPLSISTSRTAWPDPGKTRLAGVSSFGIGGTNAHVVVEQAPERPAETADDRAGHVLVLSAAGEAPLRALAGRYAAHIETHPDLSVSSLCATAAAGRAQLAHRLALRVDSLAQAAAALATFARGEAPEGLTVGAVPAGARPKIAFLFSGQGSQHAGMGRALYETQKVFRSAIDACAEILRPVLDRPLLDLLDGAGDRALDHTACAQPALFALQYALLMLWRSWGVVPHAVLGHSVGEYMAACAAGILSLEDALGLVAERGRLMGSLPEGGAMVAVFAPEELVSQAIGQLGDRVSMAAVNGPKNVVVSGEQAAVSAVCDRLEEDFVVTKPLRTSHAFHSALMDPILEGFFAAAGRVTYRSPAIPLVSNVTGQRLPPGGTLSAEHLRDHLRSPVRFADGMAALAAEGCELFIEIGPHDTLIEMGRRCLPGSARAWIASQRRDADGAAVIEQAAAAAFVAGTPMDWRALWAPRRPGRAVLPTYPFERRRCWPDPSELRHPIRDEEHAR